MDKKYCVLKILLLLFLFSRPLFGFKFVVLGDRTPLDPKTGKETFERILNEIKLLAPDFIVHLGNLIKGHISDTVKIKMEWEYVIKTFQELGVPYYFCPGSEDILNEKSEEIYLRYFNRTYYSFNYENCHFVVLDFSRFPRYEEVPKEMIDWLRDDLYLARRAKFTFVFAHRPYWRTLKEKWGLHKMFVRYGVDYLFSGHGCFYLYHLMDSVHYIQVGPSGARLKEETEESFPNYLLIEVEKKRVNILVIKPGSLFPKEKISLKELEARKKIEEIGIKISRFSLRGNSSDTVSVEIENPFFEELKGELLWRQYSWEISPPKAVFYLAPKSSGYFTFNLAPRSAQGFFPLPELVTSFANEEREKRLITRRLNIIREIKVQPVLPPITLDGELKEFLDSITTFGNELGGEAGLNSKLYLGYDTSNLYIGVVNYEKQITAQVRGSAGAIKKDDHCSFLISFSLDTLYEITFNPLGFSLDARYIKEKKSYRRREWAGSYYLKTKIGEGYWQGEMALPLPKSVYERDRLIGFNFLRYSQTEGKFLVFQPPYSLDDVSLGSLILTKPR